MQQYKKRICVMMIVLITSFASSNAQDSKAGFKRIFDGKTMKNWDADTTHWRIENGIFIGEVSQEKPLKTNTFLIYKGKVPENFEFMATYRISPEGNSGVQYRSDPVENVAYGLKGYQADIDGANRYTGQNYEERGRGFLAMRGQQATLQTGQKPTITGTVGDSDKLKEQIRKDDWNTIHIIAKGNNMKHYINGVLMSETTDEDLTKRKLEGLIGLQVHVMAKMKVEYKEIFLKAIKNR
jgi:Domain of Unknown Function (DUF1080)